jgi:hypothetical protein
MKIGGPKGPSPVPPREVEPSKPADRAAGPSFGEVLGADKATGADGAAPASAVAEIGAKLKAGEITKEQAVELLIETTVRQRLRDAAPELAQRVREVLRRIVAEDPLLAQKVRQLSGDISGGEDDT